MAQNHSSKGSGRGPMRHDRRSWSDNGIHFTVETASYANPGHSSRAIGGGVGGLLGDYFDTNPHSAQIQITQPGYERHGFLDTAIGLIDGLAALRDSDESGNSNRAHNSHARRAYNQDEEDYDENPDVLDRSAERNSGRQSQRPLLSRLRNKVLHGRSRAPPAVSTGEPVSGAWTGYTATHNRRGYTERDPSWTGVDAEVPRSRRNSTYEAHDGAAADQDSDENPAAERELQDTIDFHNKQKRRCKRRLENASRLGGIGSNELQRLVDEIKMHERVVSDAEDDLQQASGGYTRGRSWHQPQPKQKRQQQSNSTGERDFTQDFGFRPCWEPASTSSPHFPELHIRGTSGPFGHTVFGTFYHTLDDFGPDHIFRDAIPHLFGPFGFGLGNTQRKRPMFQGAHYNNGGQPIPTYAEAHSPPRASPPQSILTPREAKQLYKTYSDHWSALSPTDPNVPYPARNLRASSLLARDTIWAPYVTQHPETWSEETVMRANIQAFFLGVVGLSPQYTEAPATRMIETGFDQHRATAGQKAELISILKKEKPRWHSDRLGRRNRGRPGANQELQEDDPARAVFHAVCDLMEAAR